MSGVLKPRQADGTYIVKCMASPKVISSITEGKLQTSECEPRLLADKIDNLGWSYPPGRVPDSTWFPKGNQESRVP